MTQITVDTFSGDISFEADRAVAPTGAMGPGGHLHDMEIARLKEILRPIIVDLLGEELARYRKMRG